MDVLKELEPRDAGNETVEPAAGLTTASARDLSGDTDRNQEWTRFGSMDAGQRNKEWTRFGTMAAGERDFEWTRFGTMDAGERSADWTRFGIIDSASVS
ncbi:hypothetical protein [Actinoplanes sp. GCM10030250]|uniref:hypothetical protein n=1 Tax=Actinoplanes sp. GCM10030250 TaxID=3273376 RepID=UPI00360BF9A9